MKKKMTVALDIDDVLALCAEPATRRYNKESGADISVYDVTGWLGDDVGWVKYFSDPEFVANQPVAPGAKGFVRELSRRGCDIMVITAVPLCVVTERIAWVTKNFPEIKPENIIVGKRKDVCAVDILVDDAAHNILHSCARFPILMRKPWNQEVTGVMAANNFDDLLNLIDTIMRQHGYLSDATPAEVVCLIGPSGSGKTEIIDALHEEGYTTPCICTTSKAATRKYYSQISKGVFESEKDLHHFAETTSYAGEYYGIRTDEMIGHMSNPTTKLVIPLDVCGANALKRQYGNRVKTVYIKRDRASLVSGILAKEMPDNEKALRILALDGEERNEELCDYAIEYTTLNEVVDKILNI